MKIKRFEEIQAWQEARNLNKEVYGLTQWESFRRDFGLTNQIRRASISIMANIAEGFERQTNKEFIQYLYIASGSASELQSHLYAALDLEYLSDKDFENTYDQATKVKKLINGFIAYLKKKK